MTSMNIPEPVMALAVSPVSKDSGGQFSRAFTRFQSEDPTFRVGLDVESWQVDAKVGKPRVNFEETVTKRIEFDYLHKKQSGGQGQYGRDTGGVMIALRTSLYKRGATAPESLYASLIHRRWMKKSTWVPPPPGHYKINTDGSYRDKKGGYTIPNDLGDVPHFACFLIMKCLSAYDAEARTLLRAYVEVPMELTDKEFEFETDCGYLEKD